MIKQRGRSTSGGRRRLLTCPCSDGTKIVGGRRRPIFKESAILRQPEYVEIDKGLAILLRSIFCRHGAVWLHILVLVVVVHHGMEAAARDVSVEPEHSSNSTKTKAEVSGDHVVAELHDVSLSLDEQLKTAIPDTGNDKSLDSSKELPIVPHDSPHLTSTGEENWYSSDQRIVYDSVYDTVEDSFYDPLQIDAECDSDSGSDSDCGVRPPVSTIEEETIFERTPHAYESIDACVEPFEGDAPSPHGADDKDKDSAMGQCQPPWERLIKKVVDKHWGSDMDILRMRDKLRQRPRSAKEANRRPPIFLIPGLASTRLVAWRFKNCRQYHPLLSDIRVFDHMWLNFNLLVQMSTLQATCWLECMKLGYNQSDANEDDLGTACKLRPDEGLDAISSLSPEGISQLLVGGTNTIYAWLVQWLADNLGYDVSHLIGLPYDWRLSPDKLEERDGFLTLMRRRIEAAVQSHNRTPAIIIAHSMGNVILRYFLDWLRVELRQEAYDKFVQQAERRAQAMHRANVTASSTPSIDTTGTFPGWMIGVMNGFDEWWSRSVNKEPTESSDPPSDSPEDNNNESRRTVHTTKPPFPTQKQLWELAQIEGDTAWRKWIDGHIWTYVGLSAPMLGAINPLRAIISGENMGIPLPHEALRDLELSFGSTLTISPISNNESFCDQWEIGDDWDADPEQRRRDGENQKLSCLDDIANEIEHASGSWKHFRALRNILRDRIDWGFDVPMVRSIQEQCDNKKRPCKSESMIDFSAKDMQNGELFAHMGQAWKETGGPLFAKREQLRESFWETRVPNILNRTWERPPIKHVIMAYGVDFPTEVGYIYKKKSTKNGQLFDGIPKMHTVFVETAGGHIEKEELEPPRATLADLLPLKRPKRIHFAKGSMQHSGDGSIPYLSLSWVQTWLLHALRAKQFQANDMHFMEGRKRRPNPLDSIKVQHRPKGGMKWLDGPPPRHRLDKASTKHQEPLPAQNHVSGAEDESYEDTGTAHPHGTRYKPEMVRYHAEGKSRVTGINYTTTIIEAIGVEHKETPRNYDLLAAAFTDILKYMHNELGLV